MDTFFPEWKQSQISLLWCVAASHPSKRHAYLHAHQVDTCQSFCLCFRRLCGQGVAVRVGTAGAQKGVTKEMGQFRGARMENADNPAQSSRLRLRVAPAPLCALSLLCSSTQPLTVHRRPETPPWSSHYIANMQSFLWLKKSNNLKK